MAHERGPDIALAREQRQRLRRDATGAQRLDEPRGGRGRLLGGLEHDRVAGHERRRGHSARDREREVPGRDHGDDPARGVAEFVALARDLQQRAAVTELDRRPRVVLEEVDRLADVGVGLEPWLCAFAHFERGQLEPALAHPGGGRDKRSRPLLRPRRAPFTEPARGLRYGSLDLVGPGGRGARNDAVRRARVSRQKLGAAATVDPDLHRHVERQRPIDGRQRVGQLRPDRGAAQLEDRFIRERCKHRERR